MQTLQMACRALELCDTYCPSSSLAGRFSQLDEPVPSPAAADWRHSSAPRRWRWVYTRLCHSSSTLTPASELLIQQNLRSIHPSQHLTRSCLLVRQSLQTLHVRTTERRDKSPAIPLTASTIRLVMSLLSCITSLSSHDEASSRSASLLSVTKDDLTLLLASRLWLVTMYVSLSVLPLVTVVVMTPDLTARSSSRATFSGLASWCSWT